MRPGCPEHLQRLRVSCLAEVFILTRHHIGHNWANLCSKVTSFLVFGYSRILSSITHPSFRWKWTCPDAWNWCPDGHFCNENFRYPWNANWLGDFVCPSKITGQQILFPSNVGLKQIRKESITNRNKLMLGEILY